MLTKKQPEISNRIRGYLFCVLGEACQSLYDLTSELQELLIRPDRNTHIKNIEKRVPFLEKLIKEQSVYVQQLIEDTQNFNIADGIQYDTENE